MKNITKGERSSPNAMKKVMHGELSSANESKLYREKMSLKADAKIKHGDIAKGEFGRGKSKSGVDKSIFRMADEKNY